MRTEALTITGDYTCTYNATTPSQSQLLYIYAVGGVNNYLPGEATTTGTNNPMIGLMATLGSCPSSGTFAGHISYIYLNEVSTVATAYAVAGFATNARAVSSASSALSQLGMSNAFANANQLYDIQGSVAGHEGRKTHTGDRHHRDRAPGRCLIPWGIFSRRVWTRATLCSLLHPALAKRLYNATGSAIDTGSAAIYIAQHPSDNIASLYGLQSSNVQYADDLASQPKDFSVGIHVYWEAAWETPVDVATDSLGNAWITSSSGYVSNLTSLGAHVSGSPFSVPTASYVAI